MLIRIAARSSDLARLQAYRVGDALKATDPQIRIDYQFRESLGDKNLNDPLWKMPEKGVFTEDFVEDLRQNKCDLVVHSWKDLPVEERLDLEVVATLPRADQRDILLLKKSQSAQLRILSSSPRRAHNLSPTLAALLPFPIKHVEFVPVRGNVPTRIRKLLAGSEDGLVLAKAALDRLLSAHESEFAPMQTELRAALKELRWTVLPLSLNPTAAAQGALAIEIRSNRADLKTLLSKIHCAETFACVQTERTLFKSYGGGCHQKIGCTILQRPFGRVLSLRGETTNGEALLRWELLEQKALPPNIQVSCTFERRPLNVKNPNTNLWVAKTEALPTDWQLTPEQHVWCSGLDTWKRLAQRGVWVNGCNEGLGEDWDPQLSALAPKEKWTKLSHSAAPSDSARPLLATYELIPGDFPDLRGKTYLYWSSGSMFRRALELYPEIKAAQHYCGPGNTWRELAQHLKPEQLHVVLS